MSPRPRILVVEDEQHLAEGIQENLDAEGYDAEVSGDGRKGLEKILATAFDLIILDVMLPNLDGFAVCKQARDAGIDAPILFLTAKAGVEDRVTGLDAGGDDYLPKPFHLSELLSRVRAILRRREWYSNSIAANPAAVLRFGDNEVDFRNYSGRAFDQQEHQLTHKEAMILKVLSERDDQIVTREEILDQVWGYELYPSTRTIDNFIVRLRKRFEPDPENPRHFHTVRGVGYRFSRNPKEPS